MPNISAYVSKFMDLDDAQKRSSLDLGKISQAMKDASQEYFADGINLDGELTLLPFLSEPIYMDIYIIISFLILISSSGVTIYSTYQVYKLKKAVFKLQNTNVMLSQEEESIPMTAADKIYPDLNKLYIDAKTGNML
jgi:hypothetical protein